jgi:hypothetical protein
VTGVLHNSTPMQIDWTVGGLDYRAVAMGLSSDELLRFAAAASVQTGVASIDDPAALGAMKPLGSWDTYYHVARLLASLRPNAFLDVGTGTDSVSYGPFPSWSVASTVATSDDELAMLRFVLGKTTPATVHGNAAVTSDGTTFRMPQLAVVGWTERGRLILVAGPESAEKTIARAGTVREATLAEWAAVKQVAATNASPT